MIRPVCIHCVWGILLACLLGACSPKSEYEQLVDRELASGVRQDSLFLGIYFGMRSEDFFDHCYKINKQGLVKESTNFKVQHTVEGLKHDAKMVFFPEWHNNVIYEMPVDFTYDAWAPWNREMQSDSLAKDVVKLLEGWYGGKFIELTHPEKGTAYVKVDGNRQITVFAKDQMTARAQYVDLILDREIKQQEK